VPAIRKEKPGLWKRAQALRKVIPKEIGESLLIHLVIPKHDDLIEKFLVLQVGNQMIPVDFCRMELTRTNREAWIM
jgi:hypothetical protein